MGHWQMSWASEQAIRIGAENASASPAAFYRLCSALQKSPLLTQCRFISSAGSVLVVSELDSEVFWERVEQTLKTAPVPVGAEQEHLNLGREVVVPVCYELELGIDLVTVADQTGLTTHDVVELHTERAYEVMSFGFMPGFAYCGPISSKLHLPRLAKPRARVPAGSVAIAEKMTAVYPHQSAGGWHVIGRTPLKLFDPLRTEPSLLSLGDRIRYVPITIEAYRELASEQAVRDG
jgi:KipI family sensor histidine kinase inhibitor